MRTQLQRIASPPLPTPPSACRCRAQFAQRAYTGEIRHYAAQITADARDHTMVESIIALAIGAKQTNKPMVIRFDMDDDRSVPGCQGTDCRKLVSAAQDLAPGRQGPWRLAPALADPLVPRLQRFSMAGMADARGGKTHEQECVSKAGGPVCGWRGRRRRVAPDCLRPFRPSREPVMRALPHS